MTPLRSVVPVLTLALALIIIGGIEQTATADSSRQAPTDSSHVVRTSLTTPAPIETSLPGIFRAIGPVRWGIVLLGVMLVSISVSGLVFLAMPLSRRRSLAASLASLKEWNTVLSTLCTVLGPIGTYIGMIGALLAMHQVAVAVDTAAKLTAQAAFFQKAAQMFISSLAGIGLGISFGLINNLILHHVLPEHKHPIAGEGMIAATVAILHKWVGEGRLWRGHKDGRDLSGEQEPQVLGQ